eukprot:125654-Chlamydomonas_euryale.AAC.2
MHACARDEYRTAERARRRACGARRAGDEASCARDAQAVSSLPQSLSQPALRPDHGAFLTRMWQLGHLARPIHATRPIRSQAIPMPARGASRAHLLALGCREGSS